MHLLDGIATEVYLAYFPQSLAGTEAVSLDAPDTGCEHNYKEYIEFTPKLGSFCKKIVF